MEQEYECFNVQSALNIMLCSGSMASKHVVSEARYTHYVAVLTTGRISYK